MSTLACSDFGSGLPVVLLHGFPLCRQMWRPQFAALPRAGYRVVAPDLPGFGASAPLSGPPSMDAYADAVIALLDELEIERAAIGGMSMGGYVLLNLIERYPQRLLAALFLVTRAAGDDPLGKERRTLMAASVDGGDLSQVPEAFEQLLFAPATLKRRPALVHSVRQWMESAHPAGVVAGLLAMRDRKDYLRLLPAMQLPALVVGAAEDQAIPPLHAGQLAAGLPDAVLKIIPGAGHMVNLEQPARFNRILLDFLAPLRDGMSAAPRD